MTAAQAFIAEHVGHGEHSGKALWELIGNRDSQTEADLVRLGLHSVVHTSSIVQVILMEALRRTNSALADTIAALLEDGFGEAEEGVELLYDWRERLAAGLPISTDSDRHAEIFGPTRDPLCPNCGTGLAFETAA